MRCSMNHITTSTSSQNHNHEEEEEEEEEARCEWDFTLSSTISPPSTSSSDVIGSVEVDPSDRLLATAGIARKIRIYSLSSTPSLDLFISTPAKLSTLRWAPGRPHIIGAADYDGVVSEYDLERGGLSVFERDEHSGRRVWCMDYSSVLSSAVGASCSDDCTAQIWDRRSGQHSVAVVSLGAPVCSVEFEKTDSCVYNIGLGGADRKAYIYDIRNVSAGPVTTFSGHVRTVTYVRFVGGGRVVTSGVDGRHRMWEVEGGREVRVYKGHVNERSFVGMDCSNKGGGLIGCGSESDEVFVYDLRWGEPIWVEGFGGKLEGDEGVGGNFGGGGVSAVCWREGVEEEEECGLVAGGSNGVVKIFSGRRRRRS